MSAQLTARSYWRACSTDMLRDQLRHKSQEPPSEEAPPLERDQFHILSERALHASMQLVAWVSGVSTSSLSAMYSERCQAGYFTEEPEPLGDEGCDQDDLLRGPKPDREVPEILEHMHAEAAMEAAEDDPGDQPIPSAAALDLRNVPDKDVLEEILQTGHGDDGGGEGGQDEHFGPFPLTLHHAFQALGSIPDDDELLDALWRLTMYLRHWRGGADREFVKNARLARVRSVGLNWHQWLETALVF